MLITSKKNIKSFIERDNQSNAQQIIGAKAVTCVSIAGSYFYLRCFPPRSIQSFGVYVCFLILVL